MSIKTGITQETPSRIQFGAGVYFSGVAYNEKVPPTETEMLAGIMGARGGYLDAQAFVQNNLEGSSFPQFIFPAIFFILAGLIAFSTGTSWGTFGVLVPIAVTLLGGSANETTLMLITVSATLGGAVFGDHVSPISDTTILASAGAQCNHVEHVNTQLQYAGLV